MNVSRVESSRGTKERGCWVVFCKRAKCQHLCSMMLRMALSG